MDIADGLHLFQGLGNGGQCTGPSGACYCLSGTCDSAPTAGGGAAGTLATGACTAAQNGAAGSVQIVVQIVWP